MLNGNTMFDIVSNAYLQKNEKLHTIKELIKEYEIRIKNRTRLQEIGKTKEYIVALNDAISYIEFSDQVCSWCEQIMMTVKAKKDIIQKRFELETLKTQKQIELLEEIRECTSKAEKEKLKTKLLKENLINLEHQLDDVKNHLEFTKIFIEDAKRTRELVYSYYQAVKRIGDMTV